MSVAVAILLPFALAQFLEGMFGMIGEQALMGQMGGQGLLGQAGGLNLRGMMGEQALSPLGPLTIGQILSLIPNQQGNIIQTQIPASVMNAQAAEFIPLQYQQMIADGLAKAQQSQVTTSTGNQGASQTLDPQVAESILGQLTVQQAIELIPKKSGKAQMSIADVPAFILNDPATNWIPAHYLQQIVNGLLQSQQTTTAAPPTSGASKQA